MQKSYLIPSLLLALSLIAATPARAAAQPSATPPGHDIRVIVDVSGSMKQNDPANLRIPALRLLTGLLPAGTQAGVWTFARQVNMLVPYGAVDTGWRDRASESAARINSSGLYTDIEAAFNTATWNWSAAAPGTRRSVILLTDGLVDVPDGADADRQSRARITDGILPRLRQAGATVYSIALSDGADAALLQQLAAATGGRFEKAGSADELERIFFRMFEQAASPETLPLIDNTILVDASIEELTLLVFRREGVPATTLTAPDGAVFDPARPPPNARWHREARYDLVTVDKPATGTWRINAETDPDNRVMVVSNLRVVATQLPNQILQGDAVDFLVRFTEKDQAITKKEFLRFLKTMLLEENGDGTDPSEHPLLDDGRDGDTAAGDGIFGTRVNVGEKSGQRAIIVDVDGTTFRRQLRQNIEVVEGPVIADIRTASSGPLLSVIPRASIIDPASLEIYATITDDTGLSDSRRLVRVSPGEWQLPLGEYPAEASYELTLDIEGERPNGKPVSHQQGPLRFGNAAAAPPEEQAGTESADTAEDADTAESEEAVDEAGETADEGMEEEPASVNWILVASIVLLLNGLIAGGMFLVYRRLFGAPAKPAADETAAKPDASSAGASAPAATVFDDSRPSLVTQVAEAAAVQTKAETGTAATPAPAETTEPEGPGRPTTAQAEPHDSSAELVMEDDAAAADQDMSEDRLKNLNVEEIDLGFEEKARSTG